MSNNPSEKKSLDLPLDILEKIVRRYPLPLFAITTNTVSDLAKADAASWRIMVEREFPFAKRLQPLPEDQKKHPAIWKQLYKKLVSVTYKGMPPALKNLLKAIVHNHIDFYLPYLDDNCVETLLAETPERKDNAVFMRAYSPLALCMALPHGKAFLHKLFSAWETQRTNSSPISPQELLAFHQTERILAKLVNFSPAQRGSLFTQACQNNMPELLGYLYELIPSHEISPALIKSALERSDNAGLAVFEILLKAYSGRNIFAHINIENMVSKGNIASFTSLLDYAKTKNMKPSTAQIFMTLWRICQTGQADALQLCLKPGLFLPDSFRLEDVKEYEAQNTLMHAAVGKDHRHIVKLLANQAAGLINTPNRFELTPLMHAIIKRKVRMVELLLQLGANPNALEKDATHPLELAIEKHLNQAIVLLMDAGADPNQINHHGKSPRSMARAKKAYTLFFDIREKCGTDDGKIAVFLFQYLQDYAQKKGFSSAFREILSLFSVTAPYIVNETLRKTVAELLDKTTASGLRDKQAIFYFISSVKYHCEQTGINVKNAPSDPFFVMVETLGMLYTDFCWSSLPTVIPPTIAPEQRQSKTSK